MILDMQRAVEKTNSFEIICNEIESSALANNSHTDWILERLQELTVFYPQLMKMNRETRETSAKLFFEKLTNLYQISLLAKQTSSDNSPWIDISIEYLKGAYTSPKLEEDTALSNKDIDQLIAWEF